MTPETPLRVVEKSDAVAEAAVAGAPPAPAGRQPVTIELSTPIEAHGERLTSLTLRPLRVADIQELPLDVFNRAQVDPRRVNDYIVRLAGIPMSSVLQLDPADWFEIMLAVVGFFGKRAPTP
jgi:hypothetical protein